MYGATAGKASLLKIEACTNQAICAILPNPHYSPNFLKYNLDTLYEYMVGLSTGSARDNLSQAGIGELKLMMPQTKDEQEKLVSILTYIDRKIELNRSINDNLEKMAKLLYDYWFVQFDFPDENDRPYKLNGGKMVWNDDLHMDVPLNWNTCLLSDYIGNNNTGDWGYDESAEYRTQKVRCIRGADIIKLNDLPKTWFFDAEKQTIKDNYGVDYDLDLKEQTAKSQQSKKDFENYRKTANKNIIPFFRFIPAGKLDPHKSSWMPDGYLAIKNPDEMEYFSWRELADSFED